MIMRTYIYGLQWVGRKHILWGGLYHHCAPSRPSSLCCVKGGLSFCRKRDSTSSAQRKLFALQRIPQSLICVNHVLPAPLETHAADHIELAMSGQWQTLQHGHVSHACKVVILIISI